MNEIKTHTSTKPCERIYGDISYVNTLSLGKKGSGYYMLKNLLNLNVLTLLRKDMILFQ